MWGQKNIKKTTIKDTQNTHTHNSHNFECLYSVFAKHNICVDLRSSVGHIGG